MRLARRPGEREERWRQLLGDDASAGTGPVGPPAPFVTGPVGRCPPESRRIDAVFPLVNKDGMPELSEKIFAELKTKWNTYYDDKGAVGRRYRRQDEVGTPFCITIDGESADSYTVTVRARDSMAQERVSISQLSEYLTKQLSGV